jgi:hypothetical protein
LVRGTTEMKATINTRGTGWERGTTKGKMMRNAKSAGHERGGNRESSQSSTDKQI